MNAYRFTTKISDTGTIQLPLDPKLFNKEVEVIILPKPLSIEGKNPFKASEFVKKWAGFIKNKDTDNIKFDYLSEKYR